ncbi:MAG: GAF domain-containing protein, partial [Chloroflexi bacterium]
MNTPLQVLILEDWPDDAELMQRALRRAGIACTCRRVDTRADFLRALESEPDVILSDYNLPGWTGIDAFEELREAGHDIPFILVTGALGDTAAVECLQRGMADYVLKSNLERLPLAVRRALEMRRAQLERLRAEKQRAHIQSLLEAITTVNQLIVRKRDPQALLQGACESLHRTRGYRSIWIGLLSEDGQTVRAVASAGAETLEEPVRVLVQKSGKGFHCVRTALTQRKPYLVTDIRDSHPCASCPYWAKIPHLSALAVPLLYQGQVYGVLAAHSAEPWSFAEDESALLEELAGDLALALHAVEEERKRREAEAGLRRRAGQLQSLLVAAQQLNTTLEVPAIMRSLVTAAMELTGATAGAAGLMEGDRMVFPEYNQEGTIYPVNLAYPRGYGIPGWIIETRKPYVTNDAAHDPHVFRPVQQTLGFKHGAAVPILSRSGELLGCFEVHDSRDGRPFDEQDLEMLQGLAGLASVALENALLLQERTRAEERVQQLATKLKLVAHLARQTTTILDLEELAQQVVQSLHELTGCYNANFFLLEDDELVLVAGHGGYADGKPPIGFRLPLGEGIIGSAAAAGEPLLVPDVSREPRYVAWEGLPHTRSELAVPVKTGGRLLGVVDIQATEPDAFDTTDVEALEVLAGQLAAAIENARLYLAERRWTAELERSNRL